MSAITLEAVVENGQIRLPAGVVLTDQQTVFVVVPQAGPQPAARLPGVRLTDPDNAKLFEMKVLWGDVH
jgi:hypothetical protein